jgi:DNA polymerase-1
MTAVRKRLVVIDGKSVFYRGYYAMPGLSTKEGVPTGGVYGFAVMALEVIKRLKPDYVCVAWDKPKTNIRRRLALYPEYKAGRKPAPPDFYVQIPILHDLLRAFNWPLYEVDDYEADDIMATLASKAGSEGIETVLISSDLDMLQCLNETTSYYVLKKGLSNIEHYHPAEFEQKYGLKVEQFVDLKALKGDGSDNIPGVPGIGEKGAVELLKKYGTLDNIYENLWEVSGALAKKLEAGKGLAYLSRELVVLQTNAPVPLDLKHMDMANLDVGGVEDVLRKLEFRSLLRQLPDVMRSTDHSPAMHSVEKTEVRNSGIKAPAKTADIEASGKESVVIHARYNDKLKRDITHVLVAVDGKAIVLEASDVLAKRDKLTELIKDKLVIGYDTKALVKHLWKWGIKLDYSRVFDVHIASFMVNSLVRDQSLIGLARSYLDLELEAEEVDQAQLSLYECAVIDKLYGVFHTELKKPDNAKMLQLLQNVEHLSIPILARMEERGIALDISYFKKMSERLEGQISDLEQTIYGHADEEFNIASPSQLATILFEKLSLPTISPKKGKNGAFSTAADILDKLRDAHPIIECILSYRELTKLKSTYVDPLPTMVDDEHKLHTTFNMTVAQTGRLSSADPNLQNIPVRTEMGREIREGFVAGKGNALVSADYSQFELRLAAVLAHDVDMIEAFNSDTDIHTLTASQVFGVALEDVTKDMRYQAKAVNFGILYGQTPHGLAIGTGMTFAEAKDFIDRYFAQRQPLLDYIASTKQKALSDGYVETLFGRRRPTPDVKSSNYMVREGAYRQAINMPVQGTEADLMKMAMITLEEKLSKFENAYQILQIHDSILVECKESDVDAIGECMKEVMEGIYPELGIKLKVDVHSGKNWGQL